jgi:hypothetical protein
VQQGQYGRRHSGTGKGPDGRQGHVAAEQVTSSNGGGVGLNNVAPSPAEEMGQPRQVRNSPYRFSDMNLTCVQTVSTFCRRWQTLLAYGMGIADAHLSLRSCGGLSRLQRSLRAVSPDTQFAKRETANFRRRRDSACLPNSKWHNSKRHDADPGRVDLSLSDRYLLQPSHRRYVHWKDRIGSLLLALVTSCPGARLPTAHRRGFSGM